MNASYVRLVGLQLGLVAALAAGPCFAADDTATMLKTAISGSGQARYTAIDDLGERHALAGLVIPELEKMLADKDPQVRWRSARALGDYGIQAEPAAPSLRGLLEDSDIIVQYHAAVALGRVGDKSEETLQALMATATSQDARVARAAIAAIRQLKVDPEKIVEALGNALKSDDEAVVLYVLEAIVQRGGAATPMLVEALKNPQTAYLACTAIERIGPDAKAAAPELGELITKTKHSHLLIQALLAIANIGPDAVGTAPQIVPLLDVKDDATIPVAAAYALGSIGAKDADAALKAAMAKDNEFLQMVAAWALAKNNPGDIETTKTAVEKLVQGLKSNEPGMRTVAAKGLQLLQAPPELVGPELVVVINDKDPQVQANVIDAIASLGESVVPRVAAALERPEIREGAVKVLRKLGPKAAAAVEPLIAAAKGTDPHFITDIQLALGAIGPASAPATDMLVKNISSNDAGERESALYALRQIGPKAASAVPALLKRTEADDAFEAYAAAWALARIAPTDAKVSSVVVQKLVQGLSDHDEIVRMECAAALGDMGPAAKTAAPALEKASKADSNANVRSTAAEALSSVK